MEARLELDVLIFPEEVRIATPEELTEWELETASQVSRPTVRLFVALYPYNPAAMSPNYETAAEELPFVPGQIIKVENLTATLFAGKMLYYFFFIVLWHVRELYFLFLFPVCAGFRPTECVL